MIRAFAIAAAIVLQGGSGAERATVTTLDGARVAADFRDAGPGAPGVLFFPMCSPGATNGWVPVADRLKGAGVSSLIVTYRNMNGNTGGTASGDQRGPDAEAAVGYLRSRIGADAPVGFAGSSCGVNIALRAAVAHPERTQAVVLLSGPHTDGQLEHVRRTASLAVFSGASTSEPPSPDWARALKAASSHPASEVVIVEEQAHGTDLFSVHPTLAATISEWLVARLRPSQAGK